MTAFRLARIAVTWTVMVIDELLHERKRRRNKQIADARAHRAMADAYRKASNEAGKK